VESIFADCSGYGAAEDFEVIVVDNGSTDETQAYLRSAMEREPRLRCVFNQSNRGFAGGNNDGIEIASGLFLVLLNSDCIVTGDWLKGLKEPLLEDRGIGLIGPVTNSAGNEQRIFTTGTTPDEIFEEGRTWVGNSAGARFETEMLGFFCVALRRDVLDRVGMLDEGFRLGFYEDDDYCIRARQAGYRLICAEDVFVFHRGGATFGRKAATGVRKLMKENRRRLALKHPFSGDPIHPRELQLRVMEGYLRQVLDGVLNTKQQYRISNRLRAIESQMPRGILKKRAFKKRLEGFKELLSRYGYVPC
jgi:GT2 family glycosyltransferase